MQLNKIALPLDQKQVNKLKKHLYGEKKDKPFSIHLTPDQLKNNGQGIPLAVTGGQLNAMKRSKNKGYNLKFSKAAIKRLRSLAGEGIFGDIGGWLVDNIAKPLISTFASNWVGPGGDQVGEVAADLLNKGVDAIDGKIDSDKAKKRAKRAKAQKDAQEQIQMQFKNAELERERINQQNKAKKLKLKAKEQQINESRGKGNPKNSNPFLVKNPPKGVPHYVL